MPRLYPSQSVNYSVSYFKPREEEMRNPLEYYYTEQYAAKEMLMNLYGGFGSGEYIQKFMRTEDGQPVGSQWHKTSHSDSYRTWGENIRENDQANLSAWFHNNPGKRLVIYLPEFDLNTNEPIPGSDSLRYLSLNMKTGMYEISDEIAESPEFLNEARSNFEEENRKANSLKNDGVIRNIPHHQHTYDGNNLTSKDKEWLAERSQWRENCLHTPGFYEENGNYEELRKRLDKERRQKELDELKAKEAEERAAEARYYEEHKEEIEAERARQRAEDERRRQEEQAERERQRAEREKQERENEIRRQKELEERRKIEEQERIKAEKERQELEAVRQKNQKIRDSLPLEFPAAENYTLEIPDKNDTLYSKLGFDEDRNAFRDNPDLVSHNLIDRRDRLGDMGRAIFGSRKISEYIRNADGSRIWPGQHKIRKSSDAWKTPEKTTDFEEEIIATLEEEPQTKFQIYWPKDKSLRWLTFDPATQKYGISKNPIPAPTDEAKLDRFNETLSELKKNYDDNILHREGQLDGILKVNEALADTENMERLAKDATKVSVDMSKSWFDALKSSMEVMYLASGTPIADFIKSCDDNTAHGRMRIYEFAVTECIKAFTEIPTKETDEYFQNLRDALPDMIKSMKRDGYEPANADFKQLNNLMKNYEKANAMIRTSLGEKPDYYEKGFVDKICGAIYIKSVLQNNGLANPREFEKAFEAKKISEAVARMRKPMNAVIKAEGIMKLAGEAQHKIYGSDTITILGKKLDVDYKITNPSDIAVGIFAEKISGAVQHGVKLPSKDAKFVTNSGPELS